MRGSSPAATYQTYPAEKKREEILKRSSILRGAAFSKSSLRRAALLSSLSQQLFSAALLSSSSQQLFSAALLSSPSQQLFSAALLSSYSQQPFLSYHLAVVRGWWSASSISQQLFSAALLSSFSQQPSSAIILLWSGVGGQLVTSSCCSQGLVVKYAPVL